MNSHLAKLQESPEFAEEMLVADIQSALEQLLHEKGCTRADLARRMGVSKARVTQIFSDSQNFTVRLVARAFHALGENVCIIPDGRDERWKAVVASGADTVEIKSMEQAPSPPESKDRRSWELSNIDGIVDALQDHCDLISGLQNALERHSEKSPRRAGTGSAETTRSQVRDWERYGGNVLPLRRQGTGNG